MIETKKLPFSVTLALLFFLLGTQQGLTQEVLNKNKKPAKHRFAISIIYENGSVFPTNNFVKGVNLEKTPIKNYSAYSARLVFQTSGKKLWQQLYGYPTWGIGVNVSNFHNPEEMGTPVSAYLFLNAPFHSWNRLSFNYEIDFGLTANWKKFNPINNQYNIAIGAGETVYIYLGTGIYYQISNHWQAGLSLGLTHFSNGALKKPNFGINTFSPRIGIKYNIKNISKITRTDIPSFKKFNSLEFKFFTGLKNVIYDSLNLNILTISKGVYFPVFGFSTTFSRQLTYKSKIGFGMAVSFDGSVNARAAIEEGRIEVQEPPLTDQLRLSIFPSYELVMGPYSLFIQPGFYLFRKKFSNQVPFSYQRIGLSYAITKRINAGIALRAYNFHISDFIEWSIGYKLIRHTK